MAYARHNSLRAPNVRTIFDWFIGTGFLAVDAGAFFVALMVLLPWNLYRSPGDLWVAQPLRAWVFILTFHALVVGAIALARGIARSPEPETAAPRSGLRASSTWSTPQPDQPNRQTASTLLAQEWARRWLAEDQAEAAGLTQQPEMRSTGHSAEPFDSAAMHTMEATPWPEAPGPRTSIDAEAILADWLDEQAAEYFTPARTDADPLRAAAQVGDTSASPVEVEPVLDPELEWKWVEAAASAWLSKRDISASDHSSSNGHV